MRKHLVWLIPWKLEIYYHKSSDGKEILKMLKLCDDRKELEEMGRAKRYLKDKIGKKGRILIKINKKFRALGNIVRVK